MRKIYFVDVFCNIYYLFREILNVVKLILIIYWLYKYSFFIKNFKKTKSKLNFVFLLDYFLDHQYINWNVTLNWFNNNDQHGYMNYEDSVKSFVELILIIDTYMVDSKYQ